MLEPTLLSAMRSPRFLTTRWPWRSLLFVISSVPLAAAVAVPFGLLASPWIVLLRQIVTGRADPAVVLLLFLAGSGLVTGLGPLIARPLPAAEGHRLRLVDDRPLAPGRSPWRRLGYAVVLATAVPVVYSALAVTATLVGVCAASPFLVADGPVSLGVVSITTPGQAVPFAIGGLVALASLPYLVALTAAAHAAVARRLLHTPPADELRLEVVEVSRSRARLVDAFEAERRRIERDLHDGAQPKLVGLTLQLSLARLDLPDTSPAADAIAIAHRQAKELMYELRELIHGIRPHLLADFGLAAGLRDLADTASIPVDVELELPRRLPEHVENAAYFVAAEALANVAKHSAATRGFVSALRRDGLLTVAVHDDGRGGADPARGTGLTGLADRVAVAGGVLRLSSPLGGPTIVTAELPCPG